MKLFFITVVTILCIAAASVGVYFAVSGNTSKTPVPSNLEKGQYIAYVAKDYEQNGEIKVHRIENEAAGKPTSYAVLPKNTVSSAHYLVYNKFYDALEFITLIGPSPYKPSHFYVSMKDGSTTTVKDSFYLEPIYVAGVEYVTGLGTVMFCGRNGADQTSATTQISTIDGVARKNLPNLPGKARREPATAEYDGQVYLAGGFYDNKITPFDVYMMSDVYVIDFRMEYPSWRSLGDSKLSHYGFRSGILQITPGSKMMYIFGYTGLISDSKNIEEYLHLSGRSYKVYRTENYNSGVISYATNTTLSIIDDEQRNFHSVDTKPTLITPSQIAGQANHDDSYSQQFTNFVVE